MQSTSPSLNERAKQAVTSQVDFLRDCQKCLAQAQYRSVANGLLLTLEFDPFDFIE
jgi:hypothetical protein